MKHHVAADLLTASALLATVTLGINCGPKDKLVGIRSVTAGGCGQAELGP